MRLTVHVLGVEVFDFAVNEPAVEAESDHRGDSTSTVIGFAPTPHPGWERPLNGYDEPGEGDEDV